MSIRRCLGSLVLLLLASGCGAGNGAGLEPDPPQVRIIAAAASSWQAEDLPVHIRWDGGGWRLEIASRATRPATALLIEALFDSAYVPVSVKRFVPEGQIDLLVCDKPGVLALGVVMPLGGSIEPGMLLTARLAPAPSGLRAASQVPSGNAGYVADLTGEEDGVGGFQLSWSYFCTGDYDQNSEVNIADLTPLALRMKASTLDGDRDGLDEVLDGDGNTEVNISDITPIGLNFHARMDGYRLFRADGPDPETASNVHLADVPFSASVLPQDSRRVFQYMVSGADLVDGAYYFVRPFDSSAVEEGAASNTVQYLPTAVLRFRVPPAGNHVVDNATAQNPSLVLMPAIPGLSEAGSPVIAYTTLGGGSVTPLMLAYYNGSAWVKQDAGAGGNFSIPAARFIPGEGQEAGQGVIVAYSLGELRVVDRRYSDGWEHVSGADVGSASGALSQLSIDRDPLTGGLGVAHAYATVGGGTVHYSYTDEAGTWNSQPVYDGETIGGLSFRFDPAGGDPWLLFTHGTATTTGSYSLVFHLEQGRRSAGSWEIIPVPYPDSPLLVDLGFRMDNTPQLVCNAARNITIPLVDPPLTISLLFDVVTGEYNGSSWELGKAYESAISISYQLPSTLVIGLDLASDVSWAQPDELLYSGFAGTIDFDIATQLPTDGGLEADSQYMIHQGGGSYQDAGYYSGEPGRSYDWQVAANGDAVCAYVRSSGITAQDVLSGNFSAAGELAFWRP